MARALQAHGNRSKVYTPVLLAIFREKYKPGVEVIEFSLEEVRHHLIALGLEARNAPDVIYRMKSRTVLPSEILDAGFHILQITSRGKYALLQGVSTLIEYPEMTSAIELADATPVEVRPLLYPAGKIGAIDEQGLLSVCRYNDLFSKFLSTPVLHLKSHVRKSVPGVGQVEVDDVHLALGPRLAIIPVEAKAKDDPVNRVQIAMQVKYAFHAFPGFDVRPLTVKMFEDGLLLFMEFAPTIDPVELSVLNFAVYKIT